jgi:ATP-binding cassette subfamily B protein
MVTLTAIAGFFTYLRGRWSATASEEIVRKLRDRLYDQLQHLPCRFYDRAETGDLVQRCTSDVETFRRFLATQIVEIGRAIIMLGIPIPLMIALDIRMTLVSLLLVPGIVIYSIVFFRRVRASFKRVDEAEGRLTSALQENLIGIRVVRAFHRQEHEKEKFDGINGRHRHLDYRLYQLMAWYWSVSDFFSMGQKALVVGVGGYWLLEGALRVGTFYFFLAAVTMFVWPIRMMGRILTELGKALVAIDRIGMILEHPRESTPAVRPVGSLPISRGAISFDCVSFTYGGADLVLDKISFEIEGGTTLALLGPSGSGKSTIANLLLRFYDPQEGTIAIDGHDLAGLELREVRRNIATVMQEPFLYSKTLRDNIRLGRSSAREGEIHEAAAVAAVHDTILEFEKGYDTQVGERGVTLSGGQRQRVALARALVDDPTILILDDALSAVDTETESLILEALRRRKGRQTTVVIAHRLSTLRHADKIIVLEGGRIIQEGTHRSLLGEEGMYRRIWHLQNALEKGSLKSLESVVEAIPEQG